MRLLTVKIFVLSFVTIIFVVPAFLHASETDNKPNGKYIYLSPAKHEEVLELGSRTRIPFEVKNSTDEDLEFNFTISGLVSNPDGTVNPGYMSDQDRILVSRVFSIPTSRTVLSPGDEYTGYIIANIPRDAEVGGVYAVLLVNANKVNSNNDIGAQVKSSLGMSIFLRINETAKLSGKLESFSAPSGSFYLGKKTVPVGINFNNSGNAHLNPYGGYVVENIFGREISSNKIDPWFVLPNSTRNRVFYFETNNLMFGFYTFNLELNRGYEDIIDVSSATIFVIGWFWLFLFLLFAVFIAYKILKLKMNGKILASSVGVFACLLFITSNAFAYRASSTNYRIERDSINVGGELGTSTNYTIEDTLGEVGTGRATSTNYIVKAGYQQMDSTYITISAPSDVTLSPSIPQLSGGQANGSAIWTVTTNNSNGYTLSISASTDPAMQASGGASFANYTRPTTDPEFAWSVSSSAKEFGFSPQGSDIVSRFKDNGSSCAVGALDTSSACWDAVTTSSISISSASSANSPSGTATTVLFRAEAGGSSSPSAANYTAVITATALVQ